MATILVCDGGCGAQSPDPQTRLYVANGWLKVRAGYPPAGDEMTRHDEHIYCRQCAGPIITAMNVKLPLPK